MKNITEVRRLASPAAKPQSLAWDGATLWMGSRETKRIYAINPTTWTVGWEIEAPGTPWGLAFVGAELRVLTGETADDNRFIRRCVPGQGFDPNFNVPCPDYCGVHLGWDGQRLTLCQWYPKKLLTFGKDWTVERVIQLPHGICGLVAVEGCFYTVTTDAEETDEYFLTRVDPRPATPKIDVIARIGFSARALAWDGKNFWTNHREQNQIVSFQRPD